MLGFSHRFLVPGDLAHHWRVLFDREFLADLDYCFATRHRRFLSEWEGPDSLYRQCVVQLDRDLPAYVMDALGGVLGWIETWQFSRRKNAMRVSLRPLDALDATRAAISLDLVYIASPRDGRTEIEVVGSVRADLGELGGRLERLFSGELERFLHLAMKRQAAWFEESASRAALRDAS